GNLMMTNSNHTSMPSPWRRIFCSLILVAAVVAAIGGIASPRAVGQRVGGNAVNIANRIAPWVVEHTAYGQQAVFFVVLADQADLSGAAFFDNQGRQGSLRLQHLVKQESDHSNTDLAMATRA